MDIVAAIKQLMSEGGDRDAIVAALKNHAQPLYQLIFNAGHSAATQSDKAKFEALEGQITTLTTERDSLATAAEEAAKGQPNVAEIRKGYETTIQNLKDKHKAKETEWKNQYDGERKARARSDLISSLASQGVDPDYAEVLADKNLGRVKFTDAGALEVMAAGSVIPLSVGEGQSPISALAKELKEATPAKFIVSNVDTGSGTRTGTGSDTAVSGAAFYDGIRKEATEKYEKAGAQAAGIGALQARLGGQRVSATT